MSDVSAVHTADHGEGQLPPDVAAHLAAHREVTLFCHDGEGHPIGYAMMLMGLRGAEVLFSTYAKSAKVRHLRADPRATILSCATEDPARLRWVSMRGTATIWQPTAEELDQLLPSGGSGARTGDARVPDTVGPLVRQRTIEGKRIVVRIAVEDPQDLRVEEASR